MVPEIRTWLGPHRSPTVGARNIEALEGFFGDPAHKGLVAPPASSKKTRRERTHRLMLLGAWGLARRESVKELGDLVADELARFLEQEQRVDRTRRSGMTCSGNDPGTGVHKQESHLSSLLHVARELEVTTTCIQDYFCCQ